ncbi:uncharacterized protein LOC103723627 isoform X2 [Phoenix dactylifera]|uniref:Uncharacterized protein LOC103723627 isoform X2 n=1 Tax=Phoenix dactylifera TaxID=42345 RepID=A0A8B8ZAC7_PHODC|nr:uncharacterized protein LOC103723627 isoform X2 [Phoenix dactylifera]
MENLRLDLMEESADTMEEDEFYEEIEAPKFVDFTAPDRSRPDDRSWFCVRVGCDQNHEEVDLDALYRSFVLRVMAARSPNVGLRKALNRQGPRSMAKCPHSAPAKSAKDKISKFSTITSIPEKMAKTKLKDHPISTLRSTPSKTKAKVQRFPSEKALTTPRKKKCSTNQEPLRSVKYQKAPIGAPKNRSVAKALFHYSPKKTDETRTPSKCHAPVSEVCTEMRLNIRSRTKNVPSRYLCKPSTAMNSKRTEETAKSSKKKVEGCSQIRNSPVLREGIQSNSNDTGTDGRLGNLSILATDVEEHLAPLVVSSVKESLQSATADATTSSKSKAPQNSKDDLENKVSMQQISIRAATETRAVENATDLDDNKENASYSDRATRDIDSNATNFENENLQSETCKNAPHKAIRAPIKSLKEPSDQGGKHKRTTNPKPFRFRTDERGILKEANLQRRQIGAQEGTTTTLRHGEGLQNGRPFHGLVKQTTSGEGVRNAQPNLAKSRHKLPMQLIISKEKTTEKSKRQTAKSASVTASGKVPASHLGRENNKVGIAAMSIKAKRPTTVPKGPNFHRINLPKGCTKKPEMVIN